MILSTSTDAGFAVGSVLAIGSYVHWNAVTMVNMTKEWNLYQTQKDRAQICVIQGSRQQAYGVGDGGVEAELPWNPADRQGSVLWCELAYNFYCPFSYLWSFRDTGKIASFFLASVLSLFKHRLDEGESLYFGYKGFSSWGFVAPGLALSLIILLLPIPHHHLF